MEICFECGKINKSIRYLSAHIKKHHNMSLEEYILKHKYNNVAPLCKCGCDQVTKFNIVDFRDYLHNHYHKTEDAKIKIVNSLKNTIQNKYGVNNIMKLEWAKEKVKQTNLALYGTENDFSEKIKISVRKKYGYDYILQVPEIKKKIFDKQKHSFEEILEICKQKQYIPLFTIEQYIGQRQYLKFKCLIHNEEFETQLFCIKQKTNQCSKCKIHGYSLKEKEVLLFIKSIYNGIIEENSRKYIKPFELDVFLPEKMLAFEFDGKYWHNREKQIKRDKRKNLLCEQKGIKLFIIKEELWDKDHIKIKEEIMEKINE